MVSATELAQIESLENEFQTIAGKPGGDFKSKKLYLDLVRKFKLRRSELVAKYGVQLLNDNKAKKSLGNDLWTVYEQVAIAAIDCNDIETAQSCTGILLKKFQLTMRVGRLEGMCYEAMGKYENADRLYSNLLQDHPMEGSLHKRKIAILKAQGKTGEAIKAINTYLELFMADFEAWRELGELYLRCQMYKQSAFCYEEVLLSSATNPIINLTYAEILYTIGGLENLKNSRKYYSAAIEYSGGKNLRANFGLVLCCAAISQAVKNSRSQKEEKLSSDLPRLAVEVIEKEYKRKESDKLEIVKSAITKLNF